MASFLGARGSVASVISWLAVVTTVIIVVFWYANHFNLDKLTLERIEGDLSGIRKLVDDGCELGYYSSKFNPQTEKGIFDVNRTSLCIITPGFYRCKSPICDLNMYDQNQSINLGEITNIVIAKEEGVLTITGE